MNMIAIVGGLLFVASTLTVQLVSQLSQMSVVTIGISRERALISNVEMSLRILLSTPESFSCTNEGGLPNCVLEAKALTQMKDIFKNIPPGICVNTTCELKIVDAPVIKVKKGSNRPTAHMSFRLQGLKRNIPDTTIDVEPPIEILQSKEFSCKGFFQGFDQMGRAICTSVDERRAPAGSVISAVDIDKLMPTKFSSLPTQVNDCATSPNYLSSYQWKGGTSYAATCSPRMDPFATGSN